LTDKTSYHKPLKWDKIWDNPNREVRYDVDKMESGLEKPYWLQRIAGKRFVEVVEVRGFKPMGLFEPLQLNYLQWLQMVIFGKLTLF